MGIVREEIIPPIRAKTVIVMIMEPIITLQIASANALRVVRIVSRLLIAPLHPVKDVTNASQSARVKLAENFRPEQIVWGWGLMAQNRLQVIVGSARPYPVPIVFVIHVLSMAWLNALVARKIVTLESAKKSHQRQELSAQLSLTGAGVVSVRG